MCVFLNLSLLPDSLGFIGVLGFASLLAVDLLALDEEEVAAAFLEELLALTSFAGFAFVEDDAALAGVFDEEEEDDG